MYAKLEKCPFFLNRVVGACGVFLNNPFLKSIAVLGLGEDTMHLYTRDGLRVLVRVELPHFPFSCTDSSYLEGLANGTKGRIGLARTTTALHTLLAMKFKLAQQFSLCLPSSAESRGHIHWRGKDTPTDFHSHKL